jgi:hypothetical protein
MFKFNQFFYIFSIILLLSCDSENKEDLNAELPNNFEDIPELSVFGTSSIIETYTELSIKISHIQEVNTSISIDDEIIYTTILNEFNFEFNPYLFSVGNHELKIVTEDKDGNINEVSFDIEIKHLLMIYEYGEKENSQNPFKWIFFNDLEGKLLAEFKSTLGLNKIYTDELITSDNILYSAATYIHDIGGDSKTLNVTTTRISIGKERSPIFKTDFPIYENELKINVNLIEPKSEYTLFWGSGTQYRVVTTGGGGYLESVTIHFDNTNDIYVRYDGISGQRILNGEPEFYKYLRFNPIPGYTEIEINEQDFIEPENTISLDLPEHVPGTMNLRRYGFLNVLDIESNNNHLIYEAVEDENFFVNSLSLPVLFGLNEYRNILSYRKDSNYFTVSGFDNDLNVDMPIWSIDLSFINNLITITASNEDVDLYSLNFKKSINSNSTNYRNLNWYYRVFSDDYSGFSFPKLVIPAMITNAIDDEYFESTSDIELSGIYALDYDVFSSYEDYINYSSLIQTNYNVKELGYKQISFPIDNYSGKVSKKSSIDNYNLRRE